MHDKVSYKASYLHMNIDKCVWACIVKFFVVNLSIL